MLLLLAAVAVVVVAAPLAPWLPVCPAAAGLVAGCPLIKGRLLTLALPWLLAALPPNPLVAVNHEGGVYVLPSGEGVIVPRL